MSTIPVWAVRGAKVVCVDDTDEWCRSVPLWLRWKYRHARQPVLNEICTIDVVYEDDDGVWLELQGYEVDFDAAGFRPLVEDTDDNEVEARLYRHKQLHLPLSKRLETV